MQNTQSIYSESKPKTKVLFVSKVKTFSAKNAIWNQISLKPLINIDWWISAWISFFLYFLHLFFCEFAASFVQKFWVHKNNIPCKLQRWSRGHKARGQGQGHKKIRDQGQGQPFRGQTLSRPRTGTLEAKDRGHKRKCSPKKKKGLHKNFSGDLQKRKKKGLHKNFSGDLQKRKKKVFTKIFQAISTKKRFPKTFSSIPQNFNNSKISAVLEPRTGQFSRTWGLEAKAKDFKICPRGQERPRGLHLW